MRPDGTFAVNQAKIKDGVAALTREIMTIQAEGDYAKAKALGDRLGVLRPPVQKALDKLTAVPVDIEPRFTTAEGSCRPSRESPPRPRCGRCAVGVARPAHGAGPFSPDRSKFGNLTEFRAQLCRTLRIQQPF